MSQKIIKYLIEIKRVYKNLLLMFIDYLTLVFSFWASLSLRINDFYLPNESSAYLILLAPIIALPIFSSFGLYRTIIRFWSYKSIFTIAFAVSIYTFLWFILVFVVDLFEKPYDFLIINWLVTVFFVVSSRYFARYLLLSKSHQTKKVIVYGAGSAGSQIHSALNLDPNVKIVCFIDKRKDIQNKFIEGTKIYSPDRLDSLIANNKVEEVYIAIPSASRAEIAQIIESLKKYQIKIRKLPAIADLTSGKISVSDLKKINIQDLLKREQRDPIEKLLKKDIHKKNVIVTGAGGSIGSELTKQILNLNPNVLILFDISEFSLYKIEQELVHHSNFSKMITIIGNVTNQQRFEKIISQYSIQTVYHAAAYKHVPMVEKNPVAAIRCNIFGTLSCIRASINQQVDSFVFISTDKAVRPTNIMGATKRFAEQLLQSISKSSTLASNFRTRVSIVRFGNVLGSSGSVVPLFRRQIKEGGPITVTDPNIIRYFMTLKEASQLVIQAGALGKNGDIFLLDMGEPVKVLDLAKDMIRLSGKSIKDEINSDGDIEIKFTGLRPGEKLYEELLIDSESEPTEHEKIFIAKDSHLSWDEMKVFIQKLDKASKNEDYKEVIEIFLNSVDGFKPDFYETTS